MSTEPHSIPRWRATSLPSSRLARPENSIRCLRPSASTILGVTPSLTVASPSLLVLLLLPPASAAPFGPTLDGPLLGALDGEGIGRDVLGDRRTGGRLGPITDRQGGNQHGIRSDEGAVADAGAVLGDAVVVHEHGAGADVDPGADVGVAHVAEVRHLGALADPGLLDLHEGADLAARPEVGARAQVGERADHRAAADVGLHGDALGDAGLVVDGAVDQPHVRADAAAG